MGFGGVWCGLVRFVLAVGVGFGELRLGTVRTGMVWQFWYG